jgi:hypothetical protein
MEAQQALDKLEKHQSGEIPVELVANVIGLLPKIIELLSRKSLRKQVELQGKLIQSIIQKINELENSL